MSDPFLLQVDYGQKSSEQGNAQFRRSLYFVKDLKAGDVITRDAIRSLRPGFGVAPKYLNELIGRKITKDVQRYSAVTLDLVES